MHCKPVAQSAELHTGRQGQMVDSNCNVHCSCALLDIAANLTAKEKTEKQQHKAIKPLDMHLLLLVLGISLCLMLNVSAGRAAEQERDAADSRQGSC